MLGALEVPDVSLVICGVEQTEWARFREQADPALANGSASCRLLPRTICPGFTRTRLRCFTLPFTKALGFLPWRREAMGTPVLFSKVGSLGELAGPGAEVLPTDDLEAWVRTCRGWIATRVQDMTPNDAARCWARQFSWDANASRHMDVYQEVLQSGKRSSSGSP